MRSATLLLAIAIATGVSFPAHATISTKHKSSSNLKTKAKSAPSSVGKSPNWRVTTFYAPVNGALSTTPKGSSSREYTTNGVSYFGAGLSYKDFGIKYSVPMSKKGESEFQDGGNRTKHFVTGLTQNFRNVRIRGDYARLQGFRLTDKELKDEFGDAVEYADPSMRLENGLLQISVGLKNDDFDFRKYDDYKDGSYARKKILYVMGFYQHHNFSTNAGLAPTNTLFSSSADRMATLVSGRLDTIGAGAGFIITAPVHRGAFYLESNFGAGPQKQRSSWTSGEKSKVSAAARAVLNAGYGFLLTDWSVVDLNFDGSYTYSKVHTDEVRTTIAKFLVSWTAKF